MAHLGKGMFTLITSDKDGDLIVLNQKPGGFDNADIRSMSAYPEQTDSFAAAVGPHDVLFGIPGWEGVVVFDSYGQMLLGFGNNSNCCDCEDLSVDLDPECIIQGQSSTITVSFSVPVPYCPAHTISFEESTGELTFDPASVQLWCDQIFNVTVSSQESTPGDVYEIDVKCDGVHHSYLSLTVVEADISSATFTSDHGILTDWTINFAQDAGNVYDPRGWQKDPYVSNPISHTKDAHVSMSVVVTVIPEGLDFVLVGAGESAEFTFVSDTQVSEGQPQTVGVTADAKLPKKVDTRSECIEWSVDICENVVDLDTSGPHLVYIAWNRPGGSTPTERRVSYVCDKADEESTAKGCCDKLQAAIVADTDFYHDGTTDLWALLDGGEGDCDNQAKCFGLAVGILGASGGNLRLVRASTNAGEGNCLDFEEKPEDPGWFLWLRFSAPGYAMSRFQGCWECTNPEVDTWYTMEPFTVPRQNSFGAAVI